MSSLPALSMRASTESISGVSSIDALYAQLATMHWRAHILELHMSYTHAHMRARAHTHAYTHVHTRTHTYTHVRARAWTHTGALSLPWLRWPSLLTYLPTYLPTYLLGALSLPWLRWPSGASWRRGVLQTPACP